MAKTHYKSPTIKQEFMRERRRISRAIKRLEEEDRIVNYKLPSIPKKVTEASIRRLEKITPKYLRSKSEVYDVETMEFVTGWRANRVVREKIERYKERWGKNWREEKRKNDAEIEHRRFLRDLEMESEKDETITPEVNDTYTDDNFITEQEAPEEIDDESYEYLDEYRYDDYWDDTDTEETEETKDKDDYYPDESGIILENIRQAFENFIPPDNTRRHRNLREEKTNDVNVATRLLNDAIDQFGEAEVARRLEASADTIWGLIETIMYSAYREQVEAAMLDYRNIIYGEKADASEAMELDEMMDYYDNLF